MYSLFSHSKNQPAVSTRGFGLVELMVSITLMVLIIGVVLVQHSAFNGAVLLRSQTFEVALQIREVQLNAVSVAAAAGGTQGEEFRAVYGVHFTTTPGSNQLFSVFRDGNSNNYYNVTEAFGAQGILDERFEIRSVNTMVGSTATAREYLSIVFERPNFDARFYTATGQVVADSVLIAVARKDIAGTGRDVVRTIEVTSAGQIAVLE